MNDLVSEQTDRFRGWIKDNAALHIPFPEEDADTEAWASEMGRSCRDTVIGMIKQIRTGGIE